MPQTISSAPSRRARTGRTIALLVAAVTLLLSACGRNMHDQPKAQVYEAMPFDATRPSAMVPPDHTVSRERGAIDPAALQAFGGGFPLEVTTELLLRGQERFDIYCSVCHNYNGDGQGMIVQKGFPQPASFHEQRLLDQPPGYFYNAITNGFGRMYSYASRIPPEDRWAIGAYIKALQLSQNAFVEDIPDDVLQQLEAPASAPNDPATNATDTGEVR